MSMSVSSHSISRNGIKTAESVNATGTTVVVLNEPSAKTRKTVSIKPENVEAYFLWKLKKSPAQLFVLGYQEKRSINIFDIPGKTNSEKIKTLNQWGDEIKKSQPTGLRLKMATELMAELKVLKIEIVNSLEYISEQKIENFKNAPLEKKKEVLEKCSVEDFSALFSLFNPNEKEELIKIMDLEKVDNCVKLIFFAEGDNENNMDGVDENMQVKIICNAAKSLQKGSAFRMKPEEKDELERVIRKEMKKGSSEFQGKCLTQILENDNKRLSIYIFSRLKPEKKIEFATDEKLKAYFLDVSGANDENKPAFDVEKFKGIAKDLSGKNLAVVKKMYFSATPQERTEYQKELSENKIKMLDEFVLDVKLCRPIEEKIKLINTFKDKCVFTKEQLKTRAKEYKTSMIDKDEIEIKKIKRKFAFKSINEEVMSAEILYANDLNLLRNFLIKQDKGKYKSEIKKIEELMGSSMQLLEVLDDFWNQPNETNSKNMMSKMLNQVKIISERCIDIQKITENTELKKEFQKISKEERRSQELEGFAILPLQRMCRYSLLVKTVIQASNDSIKSTLQNELKPIEEIIEKVNASLPKVNMEIFSEKIRTGSSSSERTNSGSTRKNA